MSHDFSWSVSRHDTFNSCRRKYFYSYYASVEDAEIRRLKKLSALPLWAGNVVHSTIEGFLNDHDTLPSEDEQEALIRATVHGQMVSEWKQSEAGPEGFRLFEHEYEVPVEQEDKKIVVRTVKRSLRAFFRSETLAEALSVGRKSWLSIENLASFSLGDVLVFLRMDLAYRNHDGRVVIVDWKTGRREGRFNEIQLACYSAFAADQGWAQEPEEIDTELAYLVLPRYVRKHGDRKRLEHVRDFIHKSASSMRGLLSDPAANRGRLEDFPMVDRPQVCRRCNFRRLCFPRGS